MEEPTSPRACQQWDSHEKKTPKTRPTVHALKVVSHGFNLHLGGGKCSWVFFKTFIE